MNLKGYIADSTEKPLDNIVSDGGFCGIFKTITCIGDSLSAGEFESYDKNGKRSLIDLHEYSWGQYLGQIAGCKVNIFARGGMTAKEYMDSYAEANDYWDNEKASQAYIIALGLNDVINKKMPVGSVADVDFINKSHFRESFAGYYGSLVLRLKEIGPDAKFFFMTMPISHGENSEQAALKDAHADFLYRLADRFSNSYVIDFRKYAPVYDKEFEKSFFLGGHMNPCGYMLTARMVASYIDYIIRHNIKEFKEVAFIGTGLKYNRI